MSAQPTPRRVRVERRIYRQPNGKYAVCTRHAGVLHFRTAGFDLEEARRRRTALIAAVHEGKAPVSPRLRFDTVAGWWVERFEDKVAAGERHSRTLEAHRYQLDRHLLPALAGRRVATIGVGTVAELLGAMRAERCSPKTSASALGTLQGILRYARRHGWIRADPVSCSRPGSGRGSLTGFVTSKGIHLGSTSKELTAAYHSLKEEAGLYTLKGPGESATLFTVGPDGRVIEILIQAHPGG
jgi:hypothetical protein